MACVVGGCAAIYEGLREVTPQEMKCLVGSCSAIYEGLREITPREMACVWGGCPSAYETEREGEEVYLIIGKVINPSGAGLEGLEKKIGEGETLIEIPRDLIDKREK